MGGTYRLQLFSIGVVIPHEDVINFPLPLAVDVPVHSLVTIVASQFVATPGLHWGWSVPILQICSTYEKGVALAPACALGLLSLVLWHFIFELLIGLIGWSSVPPVVQKIVNFVLLLFRFLLDKLCFRTLACWLLFVDVRSIKMLFLLSVFTAPKVVNIFLFFLNDLFLGFFDDIIPHVATAWSTLYLFFTDFILINSRFLVGILSLWIDLVK